MDKGGSLMDKGDSLMSKGRLLMSKGGLLIDKGGLLMSKGEILMNKGRELMGKGGSSTTINEDPLRACPTVRVNQTPIDPPTGGRDAQNQDEVETRRAAG